MFYSEKDDREKRLRFSIRKVSFGAASVAVAALYLFMGSGAVSAAEAQAVQSNEEVAADKDSETEEQQPTYAAPAAKEQGSATNTEAGDEGKQESHPETKEEEANSSERRETTTKTQSDEDSVSGDSSSPKSEGEGTKSEEASSKPKVRKRRDTPAPTATPTDEDPAANQTYEAPGDGASVDTLANKLKVLSETVENEKKLATIDEIGETKGIDPGKIQEIAEFGGWTAITSEGKGKFAVARKTATGVFPLETVNTVKNGAYKYKTWTEEVGFDNSSQYALFLSKVRTEKTKAETTFDGKPYISTGEGGTVARGLKGFNGIEKTFKVYSSSIGSSAKISFKTGYTGDINGTKAKYRVELVGNKDGVETLLYNVDFDPQFDKRTENMTVVAARNGSSKAIDNTISPNSYDQIKAKLEETAHRPNGQAGTFTSKEIDIPEGYTSYKVRISSADNLHLGMGYQIPWEHYALPIVGNGFAVTQDTKKVAKDLAKKVYNKLTEQKEEDTKWSTPETKAAYEEKLQKIKEKIGSGGNTSDYQTVVKEALEKQKNLNEEKKIKHKAADEIAEKAAEKLVKIDDDETLSENEKRIATEKVIAEAEKAAQKVKIAIDQDGVEKAKTDGIDAITKVNPVGKDKAKKAIQDELDKKEAEIEGNDQLSPDEKQVAKEQAKAAADKATRAIDQQPATADTPEAATQAQTAVTTAQTTGEADIKKVNPVGKDKAKKAIQDELDKKEAEIEGNDQLSPDEKQVAKEQAKAAADKATRAIDQQPATADTPEAATQAQTAVTTAQTTGEADIKKVNPVGKDKAKKAIQDELDKKEAEIEGNDQLSPDEKQVAKDKAKEAVAAKLKEKEAEIDANANLSDAEKAAAKEQAKQAADKAIQAIDAASDQAGVDKAQADGIAAVAAVNPVAKDKAKEAVAAKLKEKEAEIDANANLSDAEKAAAKEQAKQAADKAIQAIDAASDQAGVDKAQADGIAAVAAVNPVAKDKAKDKAKEAVAAKLKEKEAEIDANANLSDAEKAAAKEQAKQAA
ncbi:DUF1542 domain-containing protein, partial [Streptococcus pseudopneumoniae]|uniref:DUF1542 domain-containing protein n=1 Tax=Streptococcus pseudopneumoniae TaxID=257758 RepID=UPI00110C2092